MTEPASDFLGPIALPDHPTVAFVTYEPAKREMGVRFKSGDVYLYEDVDRINFDHLASGEATGMFSRGPNAVRWTWHKP